MGRIWSGMVGLALWLSTTSCTAAPPTRADAEKELFAALSDIRSRGCAGHTGTSARLQWVPVLGEATRRIAQGAPPSKATQAAGYRAKTLFQAHLTGYRSLTAVTQTLASRYCQPLTNPKLKDAGIYREGNSYWVVLAEPFDPPPPSAAAQMAARVLALTNEARAQPQKCGNQSFDPAPPVRLNAVLEQAAAAHAQDMARHGILRHEGSDGSHPSQRLTRTGYRWRSMGENVASGQMTPEQVVQEWLQSPGHCATLMNPSFTEMGLAYAVNMQSESVIYWAQEFGRPR